MFRVEFLIWLISFKTDLEIDISQDLGHYKEFYTGQSVKNVHKPYPQTWFYYFMKVMAQDMGFTVHQYFVSIIRADTYIR